MTPRTHSAIEELALQARAGSRFARGALVEQMQPLATTLARCHAGRRSSLLDDLSQAALAELLEQIDAFDPAGGPFANFAAAIMDRAIRAELRRIRAASALAS